MSGFDEIDRNVDDPQYAFCFLVREMIFALAITAIKILQLGHLRVSIHVDLESLNLNI
jgi:hypothetical protein